MGAAYIDESGQPKGGVYLVLGALASRADEWQALEGDWVDAKKEYGFPLKEGKRDEYLPYHATDVLSPDSKFSREVWPVDLQPGFPFWPWHGHSIHPLRSEQHVLSR